MADDEPWHQLASRFLQRSSIPFSFRMQEQSFVLELFDIDQHYAEILELLQQMAESQSNHLVVCLDNFQSLDNVNDPAMLSQRIRSVWQHHQNATYCFIARPRDFITDLFESNPASFHSFGKIIQMTIPQTPLFADFVQKKFETTGKYIERKQALSMVNHMNAHPYYTQQLAHAVWKLTENKVFGTTIIQGLETMLAQQAILFERILGELSNSQFNFLKALASGIQQGFSKQKVINEYELGSSANVVKVQRALIKKGSDHAVARWRVSVPGPGFCIVVQMEYLEVVKATGQIPTLADIEAAHRRIQPLIHHTPVLTCQSIDELSGAQLFFKCENFQKVGAFKMRGASNAVLSLDPEQQAKGIATHSSGNHAQAVALAAKNVGAQAYIVMPENAPKVKSSGSKRLWCRSDILCS